MPEPTNTPPAAKERHPATPGCECARCIAVFEEWAEQAAGFQKWWDRYGGQYADVAEVHYV